MRFVREPRARPPRTNPIEQWRGTAMSRVSRRAVCAFTLLLAAFPLASSVRGDEITTFDLSGTFADNSTLSGTITIDTTANTVTEINVGVSATPAIAFNYAPYAYIFPSAGETLIEAY